MALSHEVEGNDLGLAPELRTTVFRIVQEAISNVAKHARAESVVVGLEIGDGRQRGADDERGEPTSHDAADGDDRAR